MTNPVQVAAQVRFALSQLPGRNAHHEFEHICRHFTRQFVCSNVLPATGPVSAGGDQGRDYETFRSYLRRELGPSGGFLGLVSEGTIAFICTTQSDGVAEKFADDIEKVCASGHPVHEIVAFSLESMPVGARHTLESATQEAHSVRLQVFDANAISEQLATPEGFWIAEQYLALPAEIAPPQPLSDERLSETYKERRTRWREKITPDPTIGDFIDLKFGIRFATFREAARPDLPFWLGLMREMLSHSSLPPSVRQRARYELVVASLRGLNDMKPVDQIAREFLDESLSESEPARLHDAVVLLIYVAGAAKNGVTTITPTEHATWNTNLRNRVEGLLDGAYPHGRASLLFTLGCLGVHPAPSEEQLPEPDDPPLDVPPWVLASVDVLPEEMAMTEEDFVDLPSGLAAWSELAKGLEETPLFPVDSLSQQLQFLAPVLVDYPEWPDLIERVDKAIARVSGQAFAAGRARDRGMAFLRTGRKLEALDEFHRVKIAGWSENTLRGSLLAVRMIAHIYLQIRLPQAAKAYALAAAYVAAASDDDELADMVPSALLQAADADYVAGAWCSAAELTELGFVAQHQLVEGGLDSFEQDEIDSTHLQLTWISLCAQDIDKALAESISATASRIGLQQRIEETIDVANRPVDQDSWGSLGIDDLTAPPFSDLGETRRIRFSALGTNWVLEASNDNDTVIVAERFAAAAQVILAELAREELCVMPTSINVRIKKRPPVGFGSSEPIERIPSNEGRHWVAQLAPATTAGSADPEQLHKELLGMLTLIIFDVSLLPEADFYAAMNRTMERGLDHKITLARPYDELAAETIFGQQIERTRFKTPWNSLDGNYPAYSGIDLRDDPGPTFSQEKAEKHLKTRYRTLCHVLQQIVPYIRDDPMFRDTLAQLRGEGWLDWHILQAIYNIILNRRINRIATTLGADNAHRVFERVMRSPEVETVEGVPAALFTYEAMQHQRRTDMLSLLKHWGLELHQPTPDFSAVESLLGARYGYWDHDIPHSNPFPNGD